MVVRGCGSRVAGGVYLYTGLSSKGSPVESFLIDPPMVVDAELERKLALSDIGVRLIERQDGSGVVDVWDIVGQKNYPNVADMIEEIKRFGISRRVMVELEFERLTKKSRLIMLHRKAHIENFQDYYSQIEAENRDMAGVGRRDMIATLMCPRVRLLAAGMTKSVQHSSHPDKNSGEMCVGLYWEDIEGGELILDPDVLPRSVHRKNGDTEYVARKRASEIEPDYSLAVFASFPIGSIDVIRDRIGSRHIRGLANAKSSELPVRLEDE